MEAGLAAAEITIRNPHIALHKRHVSMRKMAAEMDICNCFGQHGTVLTSLMAGVPLLLTPVMLEQDLTADRIEEAGAGWNLRTKSPEALEEMMSRVLDSADGQAIEQAAAAARRITRTGVHGGGASSLSRDIERFAANGTIE